MMRAASPRSSHTTMRSFGMPVTSVGIDENGKLYHFPDKLFRVTINPDLLGSLSVPFEEAVMGSIEKAAISTESKVLVIDNISILCMQTEKGEDAAALVRRLRELRGLWGRFS